MRIWYNGRASIQLADMYPTWSGRERSMPVSVTRAFLAAAAPGKRMGRVNCLALALISEGLAISVSVSSGASAAAAVAASATAGSASVWGLALAVVWARLEAAWLAAGDAWNEAKSCALLLVPVTGACATSIWLEEKREEAMKGVRYGSTKGLRLKDQKE